MDLEMCYVAFFLLPNVPMAEFSCRLLARANLENRDLIHRDLCQGGL